MNSVHILPWKEDCYGHLCGGFGYKAIPILKEFQSYAAAFRNYESCDECLTDRYDLEIGISPVCSLNGISFLDRMHDAEEIVKVSLSRGYEPWRVEIHREVYHYPSNLFLPWLQFHFFGPFAWDDSERFSRLANTVIPWLCENSLEIVECL